MKLVSFHESLLLILWNLGWPVGLQDFSSSFQPSFVPDLFISFVFLLEICDAF